MQCEVVGPGTCVDGRYVVEKLLGKGSFATVLLAHIAQMPHFAPERKLQAKVALKVSCTQKKDEHRVIDIACNEVRILRTLGKHPNTIYLMDAILNRPLPILVFEYCAHGTLEPLASSGPQPIELILSVIHQFWAILSYLNFHCIVHRDIKPANILLKTNPALSPRFVIKLADFGMAVRLGDTSSKRQAFAGTPNYMAPEAMCDRLLPPSIGMDVWSTGVVLHMLCTGRPPFTSTSIDLFRELYRHHPILPPFSAALPCPVEQLIRSMLTIQPSKRLTNVQFSSHAALQLAVDQAHTYCNTVNDNTIVESELRAAMQSSGGASIDHFAAYNHSGHADTRCAFVVSNSYCIFEIEQIVEVVQAVQLFACTRPSAADSGQDSTIDCNNEYTEATELSGQIWRLLSVVRTLCLASPPTARQHLAAFIIYAVQKDVWQLEHLIDAWIGRERISRQLIIAVRNIDHLLHFFFTCTSQWIDVGKPPLPSSHPACMLCTHALRLSDMFHSLLSRKQESEYRHAQAHTVALNAMELMRFLLGLSSNSVLHDKLDQLQRCTRELFA